MLRRMEKEQIRALLVPFLGGEPISDDKLALLSGHFDLLLKWNARVNLTAIREPEQILIRHFGESLFAARRLSQTPSLSGSLIDVGSGAGFPGVPIKVWAPKILVTLVESQQKKATFLREVARVLALPDLEVANQRAEQLGRQADVVTLRAVEKFHDALLVAASLVKPAGRLALLIGRPQVSTASSLLPGFVWDEPVPIPLSLARVLLIGRARG